MKVRTGVLHSLRELVDIGPLLLQCAEVKLGDHLRERKGAEPHASCHRLLDALLFILVLDLWLRNLPGLF